MFYYYQHYYYYYITRHCYDLTSTLHDLVDLALNMQLWMLRLNTLQLDCNFLRTCHVRTYTLSYYRIIIITVNVLHDA